MTAPPNPMRPVEHDAFVGDVLKGKVALVAGASQPLQRGG